MTLFQPDWDESIELDGYNLKMTCAACPEQYDVTHEGEEVAYFRLRHGRFTVNCPDPSGEEVYVAYPEGDGIFELEEREHFIREGLKAVTEWRRFSGPVKAFFD